jgi:hypothetical protein
VGNGETNTGCTRTELSIRYDGMALKCLVPSSGYNALRLNRANVSKSPALKRLIAYRRLLFRFLLLLRGSRRRSAALRRILNNWRLQFSNILTGHFSTLGVMSVTCVGIRTKDGILFLIRDSAGHDSKTCSQSLCYLYRSKYGRDSTDPPTRRTELMALVSYRRERDGGTRDHVSTFA